MTAEVKPGELIRADAHVHFYRCFSEEIFFDAAFRNLCGPPGEQSAQGILFLAESHGNAWFDSLLARQASGQVCDLYELHRVETNLLSLSRVLDGASLHIVNGRQIISDEGLEVLALGFPDKLPDNLPIIEILRRIECFGALPVLPWGVGKWRGERRAALQRLLADPPVELALGDIAARTQSLRDPEPFLAARARGLVVLPGTDLLPFRWNQSGVGSFGFSWRVECGMDLTVANLLKCITQSQSAIDLHGSREFMPRMLMNQFAIHFQKQVVRRIWGASGRLDRSKT